jgi:hypothetical protein
LSAARLFSCGLSGVIAVRFVAHRLIGHSSGCQSAQQRIVEFEQPSFLA